MKRRGKKKFRFSNSLHKSPFDHTLVTSVSYSIAVSVTWLLRRRRRRRRKYKMSKKKSEGEKEEDDCDDCHIDLLLTHPDCIDEHLDPGVLGEGKYLGDKDIESLLDGDGSTSPFTCDSADAFAAYAALECIVEQLYGPQQPNGDAVHGAVNTTAAGLECLQRVFPAVDEAHLHTLLRMVDCLGREQFQSQIKELIPFTFEQNPTRSSLLIGASLVGFDALRAIALDWTKQQECDRMSAGIDDLSLLVSRDESQTGNKRKHLNASENSKSSKKSIRKEIPTDKHQENETKDRKRHECPKCGQIKKKKKGQAGGASHVCPDTIDVKDDNGNILFSQKKVVTHEIYDVVTDINEKKTHGEILRVTKEFSWMKIDFYDESDKKMRKKNLKVDNTNTKSTESGSQTVRSYLRGDRKGDIKLTVDVGIEEEGDTYRKVTKQAVAVPMVIPSMPTVQTRSFDVHEGPIPDPVMQEWQLLQNSHYSNLDFDPTCDKQIDQLGSHDTTDIKTAGDDDHDKKLERTAISANSRKVVVLASCIFCSLLLLFSELLCID